MNKTQEAQHKILTLALGDTPKNVGALGGLNPTRHCARLLSLGLIDKHDSFYWNITTTDKGKVYLKSLDENWFNPMNHDKIPHEWLESVMVWGWEFSSQFDRDKTAPTIIANAHQFDEKFVNRVKLESGTGHLANDLGGIYVAPQGNVPMYISVSDDTRATIKRVSDKYGISHGNVVEFAITLLEQGLNNV